MPKPPRSKASQQAVSSRTSRASNTEAEEVRLEDIRVDKKGIVTKPEILAGLDVDQVMSPMKRAMWVKMRKAGRVPAQD